MSLSVLSLPVNLYQRLGYCSNDFVFLPAVSAAIIPDFNFRYEESINSAIVPPPGYYVRLLTEDGPPWFALTLGLIASDDASATRTTEPAIKVQYLIPLKDPKFYDRPQDSEAPLPELWQLSDRDVQPVASVDEWGPLFESVDGAFRLRSEEELAALEIEGEKRVLEAQEVRTSE